mgnify:CR=1 FL=1
MFMLIGMVFSVMLGALLHFVYDWSGRSILVAFMAPTNESFFEHLKLLLTPYLLWMLAEYVHYGQYMHAFVPGKVAGLYLGFFLMIGLHLLYTQLLGKTIIALDVALFIFAVFAAFVTAEFCMTLLIFDHLLPEVTADFILVATVMLFAVFTVYAPHHWLFQPPKRQ